MIGIISYGSGNIRAIAGIYRRLSTPFQIVKEPKDLSVFDRLILPGVGAFDETMRLLRNRGWVDALAPLVLEKKVPILGVCVGMQILGGESEEGKELGLGWIEGCVKKIAVNCLERKPFLPHMGWNSLQVEQKIPILNGIDPEKGFYFLHSYRFVCEDKNHLIATSSYGEAFPSVIAKDNIYGCQFHPEKSHQNGVMIFRNFSLI